MSPGARFLEYRYQGPPGPRGREAAPALVPPPGGPHRDVDLSVEPGSRPLRSLVHLVAVRFADDQHIDICWRTTWLPCIACRPRAEQVSRLNARQPGELLGDNLPRPKQPQHQLTHPAPH